MKMNNKYIISCHDDGVLVPAVNVLGNLAKSNGQADVFSELLSSLLTL